MNLETLIKLHNDLTGFDNSIPIVVTYDNQLILRQFSKIVAIPYMDNYYLPRKLKMGLLLPQDLMEMMKTLEVMIQDPGVNDGSLNTGLVPLGFVVYKLFSGLTGPQVAYKINFCSISRAFLSRFILRRYGTESKLLLKAIKNENRRNRKGNKSIQNTSTS